MLHLDQGFHARAILRMRAFCAFCAQWVSFQCAMRNAQNAQLQISAQCAMRNLKLARNAQKALLVVRNAQKLSSK